MHEISTFWAWCTQQAWLGVLLLQAMFLVIILWSRSAARVRYEHMLVKLITNVPAAERHLKLYKTRLGVRGILNLKDKGVPQWTLDGAPQVIFFGGMTLLFDQMITIGFPEAWGIFGYLILPFGSLIMIISAIASTILTSDQDRGYKLHGAIQGGLYFLRYGGPLLFDIVAAWHCVGS